MELDDFIAIIRERYDPVENSSEATHWLSTAEIRTVISDIDPTAVTSLEELTKALSYAGFKVGAQPGLSGMKFRWMLREKCPSDLSSE
jgi:hypothetical protein